MTTCSGFLLRGALRRLTSLGVLGLLLFTSGCAGTAWKKAVEEDTPAAYYRFMRGHGESKYAEAARERLEFHKLFRDPSLSGYESFRRRHPDSELLARLHPVLEQPAFEAARASGTAAAYREFAQGFRGGHLAARAEGNAIFVETEGFGGDPDRLAAFATDHPDSDFAAEAQRTADAVAARRGADFDRVGLLLDIAIDTPERNRVRQALVDRITKGVRQAGIELSVLPEGLDPSQVRDFPAARLEVSHVEQAVGNAAAAGELARPAMLGATRIVMRTAAGAEAIADRRFELRVEDKAYVPGTSVLFSANAKRYWNEFFVPVARWRNDRTVRPPIALGRPVVDIDGDRRPGRRALRRRRLRPRGARRSDRTRHARPLRARRRLQEMVGHPRRRGTHRDLRRRGARVRSLHRTRRRGGADLRPRPDRARAGHRADSATRSCWSARRACSCSIPPRARCAG